MTNAKFLFLNTYTFKSIHMKIKSIVLPALALGLLTVSCKDNKKAEEEMVKKQIETIEAVEESVDSTITEVHEKAVEVEEMIQELDSL